MNRYREPAKMLLKYKLASNTQIVLHTMGSTNLVVPRESVSRGIEPHYDSLFWKVCSTDSVNTLCAWSPSFGVPKKRLMEIVQRCNDVSSSLRHRTPMMGSEQNRPSSVASRRTAVCQ